MNKCTRKTGSETYPSVRHSAKFMLSIPGNVLPGYEPCNPNALKVLEANGNKQNICCFWPMHQKPKTCFRKCLMRARLISSITLLQLNNGKDLLSIVCSGFTAQSVSTHSFSGSSKSLTGCHLLIKVLTLHSQ